MFESGIKLVILFSSASIRLLVPLLLVEEYKAFQCWMVCCYTHQDKPLRSQLLLDKESWSLHRLLALVFCGSCSRRNYAGMFCLLLPLTCSEQFPLPAELCTNFVWTLEAWNIIWQKTFGAKFSHNIFMWKILNRVIHCTINRLLVNGWETIFFVYFSGLLS